MLALILLTAALTAALAEAKAEAKAKADVWLRKKGKGANEPGKKKGYRQYYGVALATPPPTTIPPPPMIFKPGMGDMDMVPWDDTNDYAYSVNDYGRYQGRVRQ